MDTMTHYFYLIYSEEKPPLWLKFFKLLVYPQVEAFFFMASVVTLHYNTETFRIKGVDIGVQGR